MKRSILTLALVAVVGLGLTARAEDAKKPATKTITDTTVVKVTVLDVNKAKKEVTVKDEAGDVSVVAVPETYKLDKVKAGDVVSLTLAETLSVGLAKPGETDSVAAKRTTVGGAGFFASSALAVRPKPTSPARARVRIELFMRNSFLLLIGRCPNRLPWRIRHPAGAGPDPSASCRMAEACGSRTHPPPLPERARWF